MWVERVLCGAPWVQAPQWRSGRRGWVRMHRGWLGGSGCNHNRTLQGGVQVKVIRTQQG